VTTLLNACIAAQRNGDHRHAVGFALELTKRQVVVEDVAEVVLLALLSLVALEDFEFAGNMARALQEIVATTGGVPFLPVVKAECVDGEGKRGEALLMSADRGGIVSSLEKLVSRLRHPDATAAARSLLAGYRNL
jgi:hypothetical protein